MREAQRLEVHIAGQRYRCRDLCAAEQWDLLQNLQPILPAFYSINALTAGQPASFASVVDALGPLQKLSDDEIKTTLKALGSAIEIQVGDAWDPLEKAISLPLMTNLLRLVILDQFLPYLSFKRPDFQPVVRDGASYAPVAMGDGSDWLWRPVVRGLCQAESLYNGALRLEHIARLNAALDVADENEARAAHAARSKK